MKLKKLFKDLDVEIKGNKELEITGICSHSQFVAPGNLFVARRGSSFDGSEFIVDALNAGAVAVLTDLYNPFLSGMVQMIASDVDKLEPILADRYYQSPSHSLFLIGITGTNGKTTTGYLLHHLLTSKAHPCGLIGTIECLVGSQRFPSKLTTPDVVTNHKRLREMIEMGAESAVMEISSHALDQNRIAGIDFDAAIFTNLSQDHLDYHGTMDHYLEAKAKLFSFVNDPHKLALANRDDPLYEKIVGPCKAKLITYGIEKEADVRGEMVEMNLTGTRFTVEYEGKKFSIQSPLIGRFNVYNMLAAIALALAKGMDPTEIRRKMQSFKGIPGRLQRIDNSKGMHLFVDFAHTDQALENVLTTLSQVKSGRIITIFGCGGERDREKRPKMARAVEKFSDQMIVTSDNPRQEDPYQIAKEVASGFQKDKPYLVEVDRRKAIERGIFMAQEGDIVLLAGRGHEPFQKIGGRLVPFDDREVAFEVVNSEATR